MKQLPWRRSLLLWMACWSRKGALLCNFRMLWLRDSMRMRSTYSNKKAHTSILWSNFMLNSKDARSNFRKSSTIAGTWPNNAKNSETISWSCNTKRKSWSRTTNPWNPNTLKLRHTRRNTLYFSGSTNS